MSYPVCPCDGAAIAPPVNQPELSHINYRVGTYADFRRAVLTPLLKPATPQPLPVEQSLSINGVPVWRTEGSTDLGIMIAEWFAYVADVLTFYNEQVANQAYLRTANLPESVANLIALLGYRPRPAIGATGVLAALLTPAPSFGGRSIVLPKGLQFQSKPVPGQAPQIFELRQDTAIGGPDQLPAAPPPHLLRRIVAPNFLSPHFGPHPVPVFPFVRYSLILQGAIKTIDAGAQLSLRARNPSSGGPWLASVRGAAIGPAYSGSGQQTSLILTLSAAPPADLSAAQASLERANQTTGIWDFFGGAVSGSTIHLASLVRQIRPGQWILLSSGSGSPPPALVQVSQTADVIWDATGKSSNPVSPFDPTHPVPIPHTQLTVTIALPAGWQTAAGVTVSFDWFPVGALIDQPYAPWSGAPTALVGTGAQPFPSWSGQRLLLQDSTGLGIEAVGGSAGDFNLTVAELPDPVPTLAPPFLALPNVLPVTRGRTVSKETLGSGDATNPAQDFTLSQSPVTYLQQGAGYASTVSITVNNIPWTEVASFYGQAPDATIFVTREDSAGKTHVMFGDGVNGARLPTGVNNVIATYRVGAGAQSPPAGKLTVIAKSYPGLRSVLNPVAVGGGADPDPPQDIKHYAPRSVLTFGRAVSVFDYAALAAQTPGVTRARAVWAWDDVRQRSLVTVYVGDDSGAFQAARTALSAAGDPNRPILVKLATPVAVSLTLTLVVVPGMDPDLVAAAVATVLTDTETGLFGSWNLDIGQPLFDSQIEAAVLAVQGAVALTAMTFFAAGVADPGPLHSPTEGAYYTLDPSAIALVQEPDPNG
jgi:predicted phage baseplate assembly protein